MGVKALAGPVLLPPHPQRGWIMKNKVFNNYLNWLMVLVIMAAAVLGVVGVEGFSNTRLSVQASGVSSMSFNATASTWLELWAPSFGAVDYWSTVVNQDTVGNEYETIGAGFLCSASQADKYRNTRGMTGWDISGLPGDVEIVSAVVELNLKKNYDTYTGGTVYYGLWGGSPDATTLHANDYNNAYDQSPKQGLTAYKTHASFTDSFAIYEWDIVDGALEAFTTPDGFGYTWVTLATAHDFIGYEPSFTLGEASKIEADSTGVKPKLTIYYTEDTPEREVVYPSNAATDNSTTGLEVADNITWGSLRLGYGDEAIYLKVNGESGAVISLELVDGTGAVLAEVEDSVRVDDNYDFVSDLPDAWYGYLRLREINFNLVSSWGYRMPVPDGNQVGNTVYAITPEHPQYNYNYSQYLKQSNTVMAYHWKTNVQSDELDTHSFELWSNADNVTPYYSKTLEWLTDNYYYGTSANSFMSGWRYILLTPDVIGSGFDNYDGLIINMDKTYSYATSGFLQGVVLDDSGGTVLADAHSCYWYLPDEAAGLILSMNKNNYQQSEIMKVTVSIGAPGKVTSNLPTLSLQILDSAGNVKGVTGGTVIDGVNEFDLMVPATIGDYELRYTFAGDGSWSYIHDRAFVVSAEGGVGGVTVTELTGLGAKIKTTMVSFGLDNPVGHWVVILILSVILFIVFYKSSVMRVVGPLLVIAIAMVMGWVDTWIVILLALGAGFTLWRTFRKSAVGGA